MLPAGVISRVDASAEKVHVDRTKDEIKSAPEFDEKAYKEREYRNSRRRVLRHSAASLRTKRA